MEKNGSSKSRHVLLLLLLLLLLSFLFHHTESALPSDHEQLSITGRRMMEYYKPLKPEGDIDTPPSRSGRGGGGRGRRLMNIYRPNGDIYTRPSSSGHGGGHIHQHFSP